MDKVPIGGLGLSPKSVEQLEGVIDTLDTTLYPAHLMIGGWRMFFAAVLLAVYGIGYRLSRRKQIMAQKYQTSD